MTSRLGAALTSFDADPANRALLRARYLDTLRGASPCDNLSLLRISRLQYT